MRPSHTRTPAQRTQWRVIAAPDASPSPTARSPSLNLYSWDHDTHVTEGDQVLVGQHIADVGSQGRFTGPHLHLEIRPGGATAPAGRSGVQVAGPRRSWSRVYTRCLAG